MTDPFKSVLFLLHQYLAHRNIALCVVAQSRFSLSSSMPSVSFDRFSIVLVVFVAFSLSLLQTQCTQKGRGGLEWTVGS